MIYVNFEFRYSDRIRPFPRKDPDPNKTPGSAGLKYDRQLVCRGLLVRIDVNTLGLSRMDGWNSFRNRFEGVGGSVIGYPHQRSFCPKV